jgi:hypothetical protein
VTLAVLYDPPSSPQSIPTAAWLLTWIVAICIGIAMLGVTFGKASATTKIEGKSDSVSLTVEDAPVREVLAALSGKFGFTYTVTPTLNRTIEGTYAGTLRQVLGHVLDGCDYVASYSGNKLDIKVFGQSGSTARVLDFARRSQR